MGNYLGVDRKIVVIVDDGGSSQKKEIDEFLDAYNLELEKESDVFDTLMFEYDAHYISDELEDLVDIAKEALPFATVTYFQGVNDDDPEWTTNYETLEIEATA